MITNCHRYDGQIVRIRKKNFSGKVSSIYGMGTTLENLQSEFFLTGTLGWDPSIWEFHSGAYPTLKV